jgi:hypothetical protein
MRIDDIILPSSDQLNEDVKETSDIKAVALFVEAFYRKNQDKIKPYLGYTIPDMHQHFGMSLPNIKSPTVKRLVIDGIDGNEPLRLMFNHPSLTDQQFGSYTPGTNRIILNVKLLDEHKKNVASTIAHEIQHALDDMKSKGHALTKTTNNDPTKDIDGYLKLPDEINARFMQALMDIAQTNTTVDKSRASAIIAESFNKYHLTKAIVGDKGYRRLLSRAYKFIDEMNMLAPKRKKPRFAAKIKSLIQRLIK